MILSYLDTAEKAIGSPAKGNRIPAPPSRGNPQSKAAPLLSRYIVIEENGSGGRHTTGAQRGAEDKRGL